MFDQSKHEILRDTNVNIDQVFYNTWMIFFSLNFVSFQMTHYFSYDYSLNLVILEDLKRITVRHLILVFKQILA